jgi:hypothetical protein
MGNFQEDYNKRLRRVAGIFDDTVEVRVEGDVTEGYWEGYCETCQYYNEGTPYIKIVKVVEEIRQDYRGNDYSSERTYEVARFDDMGELIRRLDAVDL